MSILLILWTICLVVSIVGIAARDWRASAVTLGLAILGMVLALWGHR